MRLEHARDAWFDREPAEVWAPGDTHFAKASSERASEHLTRLVVGSRRARVGPGHRREQERRVPDPAPAGSELAHAGPRVLRRVGSDTAGGGPKADELADA